MAHFPTLVHSRPSDSSSRALFPRLEQRMGTLVALVVLLLGGCAQDFAGHGSARGKSTLWQVKTPTHTVYLMGSIHVLPKSAYPLKPALNRAYQNSDRLVLELAMNSQNNDKMMNQAFESGLYPKGQKLTEHLTQETLTLLRAVLPYYGVPLEKIEPMRPWLVSELLTGAYLAKNGYQSNLGVDFHFLAEAEKAHKPISGLEKIEAQTEPFNRFSDAEADRYLRDTLVSLPMITAWFRAVIPAWQNGDVRSLDAIINESTGDQPAFQKAIFTDRNNSWMPAIRAYVAGSENVLIIVGSGHLVGKTGVIEQLRREGYPVEQL